MKLILQLEWEFVQDVENRWINGTLVLRMDDVLERISFLHKEMGEKVTLSKKELENRILQGGKVFDRQADYGVC